jgi:hypothetical protein
MKIFGYSDYYKHERNLSLLSCIELSKSFLKKKCFSISLTGLYLEVVMGMLTWMPLAVLAPPTVTLASTVLLTPF